MILCNNSFVSAKMDAGSDCASATGTIVVNPQVACTANCLTLYDEFNRHNYRIVNGQAKSSFHE